MPRQPAADEGKEHTTGEGRTPALRAVRSGGAEDAPALSMPGPVDTIGSGGDTQAGEHGPAVTGLHETGAADAPGEGRRRRREPGGG